LRWHKNIIKFKNARSENLITEANKNYYSSTSEISDEQYDAWKDELRQLCPDHPLLVAVGAPVADSSHWKKQKHIIPMSSLDKVNAEEQFEKWASTKTLHGFCVQEKLDGLSLSIDIIDGKLMSAATRGDGIVGENILRNVLKNAGRPKNSAVFFWPIIYWLCTWRNRT
jgi:DNA ligase (NAD+)